MKDLLTVTEKAILEEKIDLAKDITILKNKVVNNLIENIKSVTDNKMMIKDNYIYFVKDSELNFENIDNMYPEPVKNAFNNCINYFLKLQNI